MRSKVYIIIIPLHRFNKVLIIKINSDNIRVSHFSPSFYRVSSFIINFEIPNSIHLMQQLRINLVINQVLSYARVLFKLVFYYLQYLIRIYIVT